MSTRTERGRGRLVGGVQREKGRKYETGHELRKVSGGLVMASRIGIVSINGREFGS